MSKKRLRLCLTLTALIISGLTFSQQDSLEYELVNYSKTPSSNHLLYHVQDKKKVTAAVSEIYSPELRKTVSTTFGGWLTGRLTGVYTNQAIGEPGYDDVNVFVRGQSPLVLIDGTPQSFPSINPEQIQSITILKDAASTAMLGMRGSNGAILITTKKGQRQNGQQIEASVMYGIQQPTVMPKFLRAYDYARLYNEALLNDGQSYIYNPSDLDAYRDGTDPIGHPDVDWQNEILKKQTPVNRYDISISGGNKTMRYFVNLDYLRQQGLLKENDSLNVYSTNSDYKRYMIRSNIEVDLTPHLTAALNLVGRIQNSNQPGTTTGGIFTNFRNTPNLAYPKFNSDGSLGGNLDYQTNLYGQSVMSGYMPVYERDFKADLMLKGNLDDLVKGLWIKGLGAINGYQRETINRSKTFAVFKENTGTGGVKTYTKYGTTSEQQNVNTTNSQNRLFYTEVSLGYSKAINTNNNIEALVVASNDYRRINSDLPFSYTGVAAKISYELNHRYFLDVTAGYNGTERFPKSKRSGFFPAAGLGWEMTGEKFMKDIKWLNYLKLRTSFGQTGNANVGYYDYYQYYVTGSGYGFGATIPSSTTTLQQGQLANPAITWEKANKLSAGIDATLFGEKLNLAIDYFNEKYYDLVQGRAGSSILGTDYLRENIGTNRYTGIEVQASWKQTSGAFTYFIAPNFSLLKSEVEYMSEPEYMYEYMYRTGRPVGQAFGYVAEGLFHNQAEIDNHAFQGATIQPGDIKYKDLNDDGVINPLDQQAIGTTSPFIHYGVNTGVSFKGFDLEVLFQGIANSNVNFTTYRAFQNGGKGQAYEEQLNRWTPMNTQNATYPRLWVGNNSNNMLTSSYWMTKGDYLRVKTIEIGYSLPSTLINKANLSVARIYINAGNILTFSKLSDRNIDPEGWGGGYPIMKTITAGITIKL